ncbi:MAG: hypothetical protein EOP06_23250 [Proteobacteria bacterium]|nr:MAG: hypothetical protein EOP06_23250 [Pseudomonadota bacterium]
MDPVILSDLAECLQRHRSPGIIDIHHLRTIRSGRFHHVDAHLVIPEYWNIAHAHEICHAFETEAVRDYQFDGEIAFHLDPCKRAYCAACRMADCPIRQTEYVRQEPFTVASLITGPKPTIGNVEASYV